MEFVDNMEAVVSTQSTGDLNSKTVHDVSMLSLSRRLPPPQEDSFAPFVSLLSDRSMALVEAILFTVDLQMELTVSGNLVMILDAYGKIIPIIDEGIKLEVQKTSHATTLFRSNSTVTKLIKGYTRLHGQSFLQIFCPILEEIATTKPNLEVNPDKLSDPAEYQKNMKFLIHYSQAIFNLIIENVHKFPYPLRKIASLISSNVEEKFPESCRSSVAGYVFLRYLCPAFSTGPHQHGLLDPKLATPDTLRNLILVGKIIQNLANGILFGEKETYMIPLNSFLANNRERCNEFLDSLLIEPEKGTGSVPIPRLCSTRDAFSVEIPELIKYLLNTKEKVFKRLSLAEDKATLDKFRELMDEYAKNFVVTPVHEDRSFSFLGGNKLTGTRYVLLFKKLMSDEGIATKKVLEAFRAADKCKNNAITKDEWAKICGALLESLSLSPEIARVKSTAPVDPQLLAFIDNMFSACDLNKDGTISFEEFHSYISKVAARESIPDVFRWFLENRDNEAMFVFF
eukprot:TRINITY_DN8751_c0_g1_i6.p1 TRINITY_DN8751_c0_g1~~TRINITY_DN8751_c0_g1_i6.p1  ORF type:complete len:512 (-),score=99.69 TRINITY_DN8751_c0_g1_i6:384-1919(-)